MATEAAGEGFVAKVVGIAPPGDVHLREDIPAVDLVESLPGAVDGRALGGENVGVLAAIEFNQAGGDGSGGCPGSGASSLIYQA